MKDWKRNSVADLIADNILFVGDGYRAKNEELAHHGIPFARVSNINDGFHLEDTDRFPEKDLHKVGNKISQHGDVVFTSKGTVGRFAFVRRGIPRFVYSPQLCFWRVLDTQIIDPRFLYFWMFSREFFLQFSGVKGQTDMADYVSLADQRKMHITLPPLSEQHAIAGILGALDDKIELNRRMNRTLESMARAVFGEMMKDEGERMNGRETTVGEVVTVVGGSTPSTANPAFWDGGSIHWATPRDLAGLQSPILLDTNSQITELGLQEISSGLLPTGTVLLSSRAPIGYLAITQIPTAINQGFIAIKCSEEVPNYFILNWLKDNMEEIIGRANGTTFLEITKSNFRPMNIFIPSPGKMKEFVKAVEPLYEKIVINLKESHTLAGLRDTLLPRLMRGEVRVKDVEKEL